jgi:RNA polymerase sigma factor (sigma-70 family)
VTRDSGAGDDSAAFESFYVVCYQEIAGYVRRRVPHDAADDVIAEVFTVAWRRFGSVPPPPHDRPWLFVVARNSVASHYRSQQRRSRLGARLALEAMAAFRAAGPASDISHEPVLAAMQQLRPAEREALQLVLWEGLSHADAAEVLGCSVNAFELRYRRARKAVRDAVSASRLHREPNLPEALGSATPPTSAQTTWSAS